MSAPPPSTSRDRLHGLLRLVLVVGTGLAVADGFRWGNRLYLSTQFADVDLAYAADLAAHARDALAHGLVWLVVAALAAVVAWLLHPRSRPAA
ncbi:hypothetical protein [Isoptericola sp. AK164]|uniref:hypothetical protein n=1 Tax=Isoptericola sp. AK164 TaxID=3024246 RepID=UPI0024184BDB|nr:hypothetical protein [Isoptericola sp. AK164]